MNPILQKQFENLEHQVQQLRDVLAKNSEELQKQHGEKEDLLQEKWRQRKELTTLNRIASDFDAVDGENEQYREERKEIREDLSKIMHLTKALRGMQSK
jgi:chromosome segregation ATPase